MDLFLVGRNVKHVKINGSMFSWLFGRTPPPPDYTSRSSWIDEFNYDWYKNVWSIPEGMTATFLEATPCGVTNLSIAGHWKIAVQTAIDIKG